MVITLMRHYNWKWNMYHLRDSMIMWLWQATNMTSGTKQQNTNVVWYIQREMVYLSTSKVMSMRKHRLIANNSIDEDIMRHPVYNINGDLFDNHLDNLTIHQYEINITWQLHKHLNITSSTSHLMRSLMHHIITSSFPRL